MCTEFFLAIVYFITIFFINFFLYKLLSTYIKNIIYLLKVKNVLQFHPLKSLNIFILLHLYGKKSQNNFNFVNFLKRCSTSKLDPLILGYTYSYLLRSFKRSNSNKVSSNFYLELLENQYLSKEQNSID